MPSKRRPGERGHGRFGLGVGIAPVTVAQQTIIGPLVRSGRALKHGVSQACARWPSNSAGGIGRTCANASAMDESGPVGAVRLAANGSLPLRTDAAVECEWTRHEMRDSPLVRAGWGASGAVFDRAALSLAAPDALGDEDRVAVRVDVPRGSGTWCEVTAAAANVEVPAGAATASM